MYQQNKHTLITKFWTRHVVYEFYYRICAARGRAEAQSGCWWLRMLGWRSPRKTNDVRQKLTQTSDSTAPRNILWWRGVVDEQSPRDSLTVERNGRGDQTASAASHHVEMTNRPRRDIQSTEERRRTRQMSYEWTARGLLLDVNRGLFYVSLFTIYKHLLSALLCWTTRNRIGSEHTSVKNVSVFNLIGSCWECEWTGFDVGSQTDKNVQI